MFFEIESLQPVPAETTNFTLNIESTDPEFVKTIPVGFCRLEVCPFPKSHAYINPPYGEEESEKFIFIGLHPAVSLLPKLGFGLGIVLKVTLSVSFLQPLVLIATKEIIAESLASEMIYPGNLRLALV